MKIKGRPITLAVENGLPSEFRLFVRGWNETENGRFLFDDKAAKAVMAAYADWGVDLAIDLEHQMLGDAATDPTARDARGWCKLELRPDGSLWACDVKWTPDGAARLEEKRQRYVSPAFEADPKTKRVLKLINVAITSIPATHNTPALVAASLSGENRMDPSLVKQALEAIEKGDAKAALDILKGLVASAAGAEPDADGDDSGSEGDGAEGVGPEAEQEKVEDPKVVDAKAAPPAPESSSSDMGGDDDDDDGDKPKKAAYKAMNAMLFRLTGAKNLAGVLSTVEEFRASHLALESERQKLSKERAALESAERRQLCAQLVKLGAEFPSTVWADDKAQTIKPRWAKMPIEELRSHVSDQRAARASKQPKKEGVRPPSGESAEAITLSDEELAICKQMKCDPKDFAALKAFRDSKKG